ncbi:MAG: hypothetical protein HZA53_18100 [Planctomycetes bacterium]|nr:hypothetical protein [Planctomycetota bacterium]
MALRTFDDGTGPALYAGGSFSASGTTSCLNVARWNGTSWSPVGAGFDGAVRCLAVHDDGTGPALYAGGAFTFTGPTSARRLAKWTGSIWVPVDSGLNAPVNALASHQGNLFIGGEFDQAGATPAARIASWNGTAYAALGMGVGGSIHALASFDDGVNSRLYAGGSFVTAGGSAANNVAAWNGSAWTPLGSGTSGAVRFFLVEPGSALFVAGDFANTTAWNGANWFSYLLAPGPLRAMVRWDDGSGNGEQLYVGGEFQPPNDPTARNVAVYGVLGWRPVGTALGCVRGAATSVFAVRNVSPALDGLYVGGANVAGQVFARGIARLTGESWSGAGDGVTSFGFPRCMALFDSGGSPELVVGGSSLSLSGHPYENIVRWNGTQWDVLGLGTTAQVHALLAFDDGTGSALYAGGYFLQAGGVPAAYVARWNGTSWSAVGSGLPAPVLALAVYDDGAGPKLHAGGGAPFVVSKWDGTLWSSIASSLAGGPPLACTALAVHDDGTGPALYAAGTFTSPGPRLARWNGTQWSAAGIGITSVVEEFALHDDGTGGGRELYAVGNPTSPGPGQVARWDGTSWVGLSAGFDRSAYSIASYGGDLYVGGSFLNVGATESSLVARWRGCGPVSSICAGDGLDAHVTTDCPCGNFGGPGRGCAWHSGVQGARLATVGEPNPDTLVLRASEMPAVAPGTVFLKGDALVHAGAVFGDGVRCVGGNLVRLGTKANSGGLAEYPEAGDVLLSVRGATPPGSGLVAYYQVYYRNAAIYCTTATFNVTNGIRVEW